LGACLKLWAQILSAGHPIPVVQRSNNRQVVFVSGADIAAYAQIARAW